MSRLLNRDLYLLSLGKEDYWRTATVVGSLEQFRAVYCRYLLARFCLEWFSKFDGLVMLHIPIIYNDINIIQLNYPQIRADFDCNK